MRCNGFSFTLDPEIGRKAARNAERIDRRRTGLPVSLELSSGTAVALALDDDRSLPAVHGWNGNNAEGAEGSVLSAREGLIACTRDIAGTRPLYMGTDRSWVATDHRFLPGEDMILIPPGSIVNLKTGKLSGKMRSRKRFHGSFEEAGAALAAVLDEGVRERVSGRKAAIAFSGGLDSAILALCAKKYSKALAVTVRTPSSHDRASAPKAAEALGIELLERGLDEEVVRRELSAVDLPFAAGAMDKSLWCIYSIASRAAADAGADIILLGQLADELFGGYMKYLRVLTSTGADECEKLMDEDIEACGRRGFLRDEASCSRWMEPRFPYADPRVVELGRGIPLKFKIKDGIRKAVLREAARQLGLPGELLSSPKKAAQYSSGASKLVG